MNISDSRKKQPESELSVLESNYTPEQKRSILLTSTRGRNRHPALQYVKEDLPSGDVTEEESRIQDPRQLL